MHRFCSKSNAQWRVIDQVLGVWGDGLKIRGLELRQHSTCSWIAQLQQHALEMLAETEDLVEGIPSYRVQCRVRNLSLMR